MQPVPRIFVSATSRDLRTARGLVSEGLRRMECLPIVQDDFPPDYKSVRDMLRTKISACNAVVHLAGFYYGAEPQPVIPGPDRRSFTQMEYEIAMELKLPCYVFLCGKDFPFDPHEPESEDKQQLQIDHRNRLLQRDELFYEFASPEELANRTRELQLSVENLRGELAKERARRRLAMIAAVVALVVAVGGGIWLRGRQKVQEAVNVQQTSEIASLKAQLEGPWVIVNKVNAAMEAVSKESKASPAERKRVAIEMVAAETHKAPEEIEKAIAATTQLAEKLIAAARAEGQGDTSKLAASRKLESETYRKLGAAHEAAARYTEALAAYQQSFELLDRNAQPEEWMDALCSIADMEFELGKLAGVGGKFREALEFGESNPSLGVGHRTTIFAAGRLISFFQYTERDLPGAEKLMRRIVERRETGLGAEHAETLNAMGDLSEILAAQGKNDEAKTLSSRALEISERVFGPDHEVTMNIVSSLSGVLDETGDANGAIKLKRRVVAFREKKAGSDSKLTLAGTVVLATMLDNAGETEEAGKLFQKVLAAREKKLGPEHPDTLDSLENVAGNLAKKEDFAGAEKLYRRVLGLRERTQGADHPDTLSTVDDIASLRWDQDDLPGAEKLYRRVFETRERTLGPNHPSTLDALDSVAGTLDLQKDYPAAETLYRRLLAAREKAEPASSPAIAAAAYDLADVLASAERTSDALPLARRAVEIAGKALPEGDRQRVRYEKLLTRLTSPADSPTAPAKAPPSPKSTATEPTKAPPSLTDYADFRKEMNEKSDGKVWQEVRKDLVVKAGGGRHYVLGWVDGKKLQKLMHVDARSDADSTITFYYWQKGWLTSVFEVRKGAAARGTAVKEGQKSFVTSLSKFRKGGGPTVGNAKATDTYNLLNEKLVSWKRTEDDEEKIEDADDVDFEVVGKRLLDEAAAAAAPILSAIGAE